MPAWRSSLVLAACLLPLLMSGCADVQSTVFLATAGERPGERQPYVTELGAERVGRTPPALGRDYFRPVARTQVARTDTATPAGRVLTQANNQAALFARRLSDTDDSLQFRRSALQIYFNDYVVLIERMRLQPGDPLPESNRQFDDRVVELKSLLQKMQGETVRMSGLAIATEADIETARNVGDAIRAAAGAAGTSDADRQALTALDREIAANAETAGKLVEQIRRDLARLVEYTEGQFAAVSDMQQQVIAAKGAPRPKWLRDTIWQ